MDQTVVDLGDDAGRRRARWSPSSAPATRASRPSPSGRAGPDTIEHEIVTGHRRRRAPDGDQRRTGTLGAGDERPGRRHRRRPNCEHDVSLASAAAVAAALDPAAYDVVRLTIGRDGDVARSGGRRLGLAGAVERAAAAATSCSRSLHGPRGEDGTLAALCELAGVPVRRLAASRAGALAMDKWATKLVAEALGHRAPHRACCSPATGARRTPGAARSWSSRSPPGPATASRWSTTPAELPAALAAALALDDRVLVEDVVVRPRDRRRGARPARRQPARRARARDRRRRARSTPTTKYDGGAEFRSRAALDDADAQGARGRRASRCTTRSAAPASPGSTSSSPSDGPVLNEVNTMPGLTEQSQVPKMFAAAGLPYADLLDVLVDRRASAGVTGG